MFKAKKPCKFGDRQFYIGDEIPAELIDPNRVNTLNKYGTIESVPEAPSEPSDVVAGTNTNPGTKNGAQGDKQALNNAQTAAKKQPAKKGGK